MNFKSYFYLYYSYPQYINDIQNKKFNTSMEKASKTGHIEIVKIMLDKGANSFNLSMKNASYNGYIEIVKLMLDKGANNFNRSMRNASSNGHIEIVKLLKKYKK